MHPKVVIIVQARMQSERLPGKVLLSVNEKTLLQLQLERLKNCANADEVVVATTTNPLDDPIAELCEKLQFPVVRGSEEDVLARYLQTAHERDADVVVRVTADCPLLDPEIVERVIEAFIGSDQPKDYVSNILERTFPRGMDVEVFSIQALEKAAANAKLQEEREHVTLYIYTHPDAFQLANVPAESSLPSYRLTVDTAEDFVLIRLLIKSLPQNFHLVDILTLLESHPEWAKINAHVPQKPI